MATKLTLKTKHDWAAAWLTFLAGATLEEISEMFKISYKVVVNYSADHMWTQRRAGARKKAHGVTLDQLKQRIERNRVRHLNHMLTQIEETEEHIASMQVGTNKEAGQVPVTTKLSAIEQHDRIARKTLGLDKEDHTDTVKEGFAFLMGFSRREALGNENIKQLESSEERDNQETQSSQTNTTGGEETIIEVDAQIEKTGPSEQPQNDLSATIPLPGQTKTFPGILGPFNAHINGHHEPTNEPKTDEPGKQTPLILKL